ncbi:hypothetical protein LTR50_005001 [Elasticomyces elasticus]|nr:hypothetical protein LTR50_005001 [Elasticomyces elasticus]
MLLPLSLLPFAASALAQAADFQIPIALSTLADIPLLGFGTWNLDRSNASEAVSLALRAGYRHIDGAAAYRNEDLVGKGIADGLAKAGLSREDVWITSKLWNDHHAPDMVARGLEKTLSDLNLTYLDLYHMHWPVASSSSGNKISYVDTWKAMIALLQTGKVRHIGVCNFDPEQLQTLLNSTTHPPSVHQMELHPYLPQTEWLAFHKAHGIHVTAYSPLAGTNPTYSPGEPPQLLNNTVVLKIAKDRGCTAAQVALAWGISRGTSVIPKSSHADRIEENFATRECELEDGDYKALEELGEKFLHRYNNPSGAWGVPLYQGLEDA